MNTYITEGVCSSKIEFDIQDDIIVKVKYTGGCDGNLKGICSLVTGMSPRDAVERLKGIKCGSRSTSCPDQLTKALAGHVSAG